MSQLGLDWSRDVNLPVSGRTPAARHAGATGAQVAAKARGEVALAYRRLLIESGPQSDQEAAKALGRLVCSMQSTRHGWGTHVVPSGQFELTPFNTKRVRWCWCEDVE